VNRFGGVEKTRTKANATAKGTAGPSTHFGAKNAPNFAQDDRFVVVLTMKGLGL
jgi:hypothetical protein